MTVSLCMIAYNEANALKGLFKDISLQDYPHENIEVVFVDSMSTDGTYEMMERFKNGGYNFWDVKIVQCAKKNQAFSWNAALMTARGDIIIRVDAHARIPRNFVSRNVYNMKQGEYVVGGGRPNISSHVSPWKLTLLAAEDSLFGSSIASYRRPAAEKNILTVFFMRLTAVRLFKRWAVLMKIWEERRITSFITEYVRQVISLPAVPILFHISTQGIISEL